VILVEDGNGGDGRALGLERKMKEVRIDVTISEKDSPGLERSRMYQSAGLTRASVTVSWRVDCQGRRRCVALADGASYGEGGAHNCKGNAYKSADTSHDIVDLLAQRSVVLLRPSSVPGAMRRLCIPHEVDIGQKTAQD